MLKRLGISRPFREDFGSKWTISFEKPRVAVTFSKFLLEKQKAKEHKK